MSRVLISLALILCSVTAGCVSESTGPDARCQWSGDTAGLSDDARRAQIIAIRYADGHSRPGTAFGATMEDYNNTRDSCMAALFQVIASRHSVTSQEVREAMYTHPPTGTDAIVILSFGLAYAFFASRFARRVWQRFPPIEGQLPGILATIVISPLASLLGNVLGEGWSRYSETLRIGYGHLNQRAERIPWAHHRVELFAAGLVMFWIASWLRYREARFTRPQDSSPTGLTSLFAREK